MIPAPPLDKAPAEQAPAVPPVAPGPVNAFMPPVFADGARLWACLDAAQGASAGASCKGLKAGKAFCRMQGFSGALQTRADGASDLMLATVRPENRVRAINGDACTTNNCVAISELHCAP